MVPKKSMIKEEKPEESKQKFQKQGSKSNFNYNSDFKRLTTNRMYNPDSLVKRGRWATAVDISKDIGFDKLTTKYMEPGIDWTNGMFAHPGDWGPTEMIYYHDGSDYILKGIVSVLDCLDYCASLGDCGFMIKGDDKELWHSSIVKQHDEPVGFNVALKGINKLTLITNDGGDGTLEDWSIWMDLEVIKQPDKDNLIINGSFDEGSSVGSFKLFSKGNGIPGWKVTRGTVDLVGNYFVSADGINSLDLNGTSYGELQQNFSTIKGKQYKLSFYLAGNPAGAPTIKKLLVTVGNKSKEYQFDITGKNVREMGWEYHELIFTASDRSTILTFKSNHKSGPASAGPVIDNVKIFEIESEEIVNEAFSPKIKIADDSVIRPMADSYVYAYEYRNWDKANFGKSEFLSVGWHSTGGEQRTYLKFDLPNIDVEALDKAVIKLYHHSTIGKNINTIGVHNVLENWEEGIGTFHSGQSEDIDSTGAITWDVQPVFKDNSIVQFKPKKKKKKNKNKFLEIDITLLVIDWISGSPNNGIMLKPEGKLSGRLPTSIYTFYSKEYKNKKKRPILILDINK